MSLHTCGANRLVAFKAKHPKIKTGQGCIKYKAKDRIPIRSVKTVIKYAIEQSKVAK